MGSVLETAALKTGMHLRHPVGMSFGFISVQRNKLLLN